MNFHTLTVRNKHQETSDTVSIEFDMPAALHDTFAYKPGQYITIEHEINGETLRRSYSLCSATHEKRWAIGVKKVQDGRMSTYLVDQLQSGDTLSISTPEGKFVGNFDASKRRHHYMIAGGSGITPMLSLIKDGLELEPMSSYFLLYGSNDENEIIFDEQLAALQERYGSQVQVQHVIRNKPEAKLFGLFSKKPTEGQHWAGLVDNKKLQQWVKVHPLHREENHLYLCGPAPLMQLSEAWFKKQHSDKLTIHREYFTNPDQPAAVSGTPVDAVMTYKSLNGADGTVDLPANKTVLDGLMDHGEDPPYSCMNGVCSSCVAKLTKGQVAMDTCLALEDDEIKAGYILTCQAKALTPEIEVQFE